MRLVVLCIGILIISLTPKFFKYMKIKSLLIGIGLALAIYLILPIRIFQHGIKGSGNVVKENREVPAFHGIDAGSVFHIYVKKGTKQSLIIETDDNIQEQIKAKVSDGVLNLETKGSIINPEKMNVYIVMPNIDELDLSGACKMETEGRFESEKMELDLSGASGLTMSIKVNNLDLDLSGASKTTLDGFASKVELEASGASHVYMENLEVNNATVDCSGAAKVNIYVVQSLKGECSGASHIKYTGEVKQVNIETSGAGSVSR